MLPHGRSFQSTHSITECDHYLASKYALWLAISIHALHYRVRSGFAGAFNPCVDYFNPRTPLQSAMIAAYPDYNVRSISIHALHYRVRFADDGHNAFVTHHFNPRTPLQSAIGVLALPYTCSQGISIHALHYRVRLLFSFSTSCGTMYFNPRTPLQSAI